MSPTASIRLNAQVQGIGPHFKIKINLQVRTEFRINVRVELITLVTLEFKP